MMTEVEIASVPVDTKESPAEPPYVYRVQPVWRNVMIFFYLHCVFVYTLFNIITLNVNFHTFMFSLVFGYITALGTTAGAHRLWAHNAYRAKWPLRVLLAYFQTVAYQNHIFEWARDHRVHHKYADSDADPHNSTRGFFFCHIGWLLVRKHRDVITKGKAIDVSDLEKDWVVNFQRKYYMILMPLCTFITPTLVPMYFWGEHFWSAWHMCCFRYILSVNSTWCVNSVAHMWGMKPYDKTILPVENMTVALMTMGEGWHNFHHSFPWDYRGSEMGSYSMNLTTLFLDICSKLGLAYNMRTVSDEVIRKRIMTVGDGTHSLSHHNGTQIWGWNDKDNNKVDEIMQLINPKEKKVK